MEVWRWDRVAQEHSRGIALAKCCAQTQAAGAAAAGQATITCVVGSAKSEPVTATSNDCVVTIADA